MLYGISGEKKIKTCFLWTTIDISGVFTFPKYSTKQSFLLNTPPWKNNIIQNPEIFAHSYFSLSVTYFQFTNSEYHVALSYIFRQLWSSHTLFQSKLHE